MRISLLLSLLFMVPLIAVIVTTYNSLPPVIPFYNSMPWGEDRLAQSGFMILLPIIVFIIFTGNLIQAAVSYTRYVLVARILLFNTFLFLLLGLLAYLQILFLTF